MKYVPYKVECPSEFESERYIKAVVRRLSLSVPVHKFHYDEWVGGCPQNVGSTVLHLPPVRKVQFLDRSVQKKDTFMPK